MRALRFGRVTTALLSLFVTTFVASAPALAASSMTLTVDNASSRAVTGFYFSLYADRGWGPDQLNGEPVAAGGSVTLTVACTSGSIVAIAEDEGGCFLYRTLSCGGDATWTITSSTTRDCGR